MMQHPPPATSGNGELWHGSEPFRIIVIGASAGGVEALSRLVRPLPPNLPAAVFVVLHISPAGPSILPDILSRAGPLAAHHARDGDKIAPGHIYIAPPDHHLLVKPGKMVVSRGPRENNARPAVDPLFRTAARSYGPWSVGVILSGGLDDGTQGLMDVKRFGGVALVQDPREAMFPSMPQSAIENVRADRVLLLDEIGLLLTRLAHEPVPQDSGAEFMARNNGAYIPDIAEVGNDDLKTHNMTGPPSKFTCPECGGALWELQDGDVLRYRCHVGHGYSAKSLMSAQGSRLENALWSALRALEESAGMRRRMATRARKGGWELMARNYEEQAEHAETRAGLVRSVLVEEHPGQITRSSATSTQGKAIRSRDLDTGRSITKPVEIPASVEISPSMRRRTRGDGAVADRKGGRSHSNSKNALPASRRGKRDKSKKAASGPTG